MDTLAAVPSSTPTEVPADTRRKLRDLLTREEIGQLTARSDLRGAWGIASTWAIIAGAMAILTAWPNPVTFVLALFMIAGRQLALAILQHEGAHGTLFRTRWMNDVLTDWLCARPVWQNLQKYRSHHFVHHTMTGTDEDPDISLHIGYPVSRRSLLRKFARDVAGITGLKVMLGLVLMDAGVFKWTVANHLTKLPQEGRRWFDYPVSFFRSAGGMIATNLILFGLLAATGHAWLYGVWVLAYLTPFPLFVRVRSIAEHGVLERVPDMFRNTRSTRAGLLLRMTVAPCNVNYHLEHHAMASVPYYRLPKMHRLMREKNAVPAAPGYGDVLRLASAGA
jgi:fatty acid desaturase